MALFALVGRSFIFSALLLRPLGLPRMFARPLLKGRHTGELLAR